MINLGLLAALEERKLKALSADETFRFFCLKLLDADYVMGRENIFEVDCSGTICFPLFCMGLNIRSTAHYLHSHLFTKPAGDIREYHDRTLAVFYSKYGNISHVSPVVGRNVILDAVNPSQPVQLKALPAVASWYEDNDYTVHFRELDWGAARSVSKMAEHSWEREADNILKELV